MYQDSGILEVDLCRYVQMHLLSHPSEWRNHSSVLKMEAQVTVTTCHYLGNYTVFLPTRP